MDFLYFQAAGDQRLRLDRPLPARRLLINTCTTYKTAPTPGCIANFDNGRERRLGAAAASADADGVAPRSPQAAARLAAGRGAAAPRPQAKRVRLRRGLRRRAGDAPSSRSASRLVLRRPAAGAAPAARRRARAARASERRGRQTLLDYLLGG